jgi:hypothetical protein
VYYDENEVFNNYLDYYTEEVVISNITIDASRALFLVIALVNSTFSSSVKYSEKDTSSPRTLIS